MLTRGDVHDPVIEGHLITMPEVRVSADLRLATIYVMPMGGRDAEEVVAAFERHKKYLRAEIAHRINLKFAPDIRFRVDDRFAEAERIDKLLRSPEVKRDLEQTRTASDRTRFERSGSPSDGEAPRVVAPGRQDAERQKKKKRDKHDVHGWVVLDKPVGMTSTHAVSVVKRLFTAKRAGHAGTLDPLASGALPIALGEATKTVPFVMDGRKLYRFTVRWGEERDTDDAEGRVIAGSDQRPSAEAIRALLPSFTGRISRCRRAIRRSRSRASAPTISRATAKRWNCRPPGRDRPAGSLNSSRSRSAVLEAECGKGPTCARSPAILAALWAVSAMSAPCGGPPSAHSTKKP